MVIWMAAVLATAVFPPQDDRLPRSLQMEEEPSPVEGIVEARVGVWGGRQFKFQAIRTDNTQATSQEEAFFSASILGGVQLYDHVVILATYEADVVSKINGEMAGAFLGWREHPKEKYGKGVPDELMLYAGALTGRLTVHETDFGTFKRGTGFAGGVSMGWTLSPQFTALLMFEYRYIKFDYQETVVSGDTSIGGNTIWLGVGIDFRF